MSSFPTYVVSNDRHIDVGPGPVDALDYLGHRHQIVFKFDGESHGAVRGECTASSTSLVIMSNVYINSVFVVKIIS